MAATEDARDRFGAGDAADCLPEGAAAVHFVDADGFDLASNSGSGSSSRSGSVRLRDGGVGDSGGGDGGGGRRRSGHPHAEPKAAADAASSSASSSSFPSWRAALARGPAALLASCAAPLRGWTAADVRRRRLRLLVWLDHPRVTWALIGE